MPRWSKYILLMLVLLLIGSIPMAMQYETGSIQGVITDNMVPVARATVEACDIMTGAVARTETNTIGNYRFEGLRPGRYSLWVYTLGPGSMWVREVIVERDHITRKDIDLAQARLIPTSF
jgi:hypothetical protein